MSSMLEPGGNLNTGGDSQRCTFLLLSTLSWPKTNHIHDLATPPSPISNLSLYLSGCPGPQKGYRFIFTISPISHAPNIVKSFNVLNNTFNIHNISIINMLNNIIFISSYSLRESPWWSVPVPVSMAPHLSQTLRHLTQGRDQKSNKMQIEIQKQNINTEKQRKLH